MLYRRCFLTRLPDTCASVASSFRRNKASFLIMVIALSAIPVLASSIPSRRSLADRLQHGPGNINHPVGVVPSSAIHIPEGWPLDMNGAITCKTCHTSLPRLDGSGGVELRGQSDSAITPAFCAKCHSSKGHSGAAGMHWMAIGSAHIRDQDNRMGEVSGVMDAESRRCLSCHDGVSAVDRTSGMHKSGHGGFMPNGGEHPIGVGYSASPAKSRKSRLRPIGLVSQHIRLPGGRVSCVSCHNLYSREKHLLAVTIQDSALCFGCHNMD